MTTKLLHFVIDGKQLARFSYGSLNDKMVSERKRIDSIKKKKLVRPE